MRPVPHTKRVGIVLSGYDGAHLYDAYSNRIVALEGHREAAIASGLVRNLPPAALEAELVEAGVEDVAREVAEFEAACGRLGILPSLPLRDVAPPPRADFLQHHLEHHLQAVVLNVTEECSLRCRYCVFGGHAPGRRQHSQARMSQETARRALEFFFQRTSATGPPPAVCFYGGEPLTRPGFVAATMDQALELAQRPVSYHLTTNGVALNRKDVRDMLAARKVSLLVSLDGPADVHDGWRVTAAGEPTHALVEGGLTALLAEHTDYYGACVMFSAVLTPPARTSRVLDYFQSSPLFQRSARVLRMSHVDRGDNPCFEGLDDPAAAVRQAQLVGERYVASRSRDPQARDGLESVHQLTHGLLAQRRIEPLPQRFVPQGYCVPGGRKLYVGVDGALGMCEKVGEALPIGSLARGFDLERIRAILEELHRLWRRSCSWCPAQRFCSVCPASVVAGHTLSRSRFREQCHATRRTFRRALEAFVRICSANPAYLDHLRSMTIT